MATSGNLAILEVSEDGGITWEGVGCSFVINDVDWGTIAVNKEYCINSNNPIITTGNKEFGTNTIQYAWTEADLNAGNVILRDAMLATTDTGKKVMIRVEVNNSTGTNGTQYASENIVTGYKHLGFTKDGSIKTEVVMEQLSDPEETPALA